MAAPGGSLDMAGSDGAAADLQPGGPMPDLFMCGFPGGTPLVDVLFMIDNSPSMIGKQKALVSSAAAFIDRLDAAKVDYHIGIATSDVGTYVAAGKPWAVSLGACNSFEGDDGTLQRVACTTRPLLAASREACAGFCPDPSFVPMGGQGYIARDAKGVTNVPKDDVKSTFKCIAALGEGGCGIEGQLESTKRALDGHNALNAGFLRTGSVLVIILLTDEDDCSVSLAGRVENDPMTMDCPQPNQDAPFSCYNPDYRCIARDVQCDAALNVVGGPETNCQERATSYLDPVKKYVDFLSALRDPSHLVVAGFWSPKGAPFNVVRPEFASTKSEGLNRGTGAQAACVNAQDATLFGRPQLRLSKFASQAGQASDSIETSICDTQRYPVALGAIADKLTQKVSALMCPR